MKDSKSSNYLHKENNWKPSLTSHYSEGWEIGSKNGINVIDSYQANATDIDNFINDIVGLKPSQEPATATPSRTKRVAASSSNVKFGKLTLQRGPSKDSSDHRKGVLNDNKISKLGTSASPNNASKTTKSKLLIIIS